MMQPIHDKDDFFVNVHYQMHSFSQVALPTQSTFCALAIPGIPFTLHNSDSDDMHAVKNKTLKQHFVTILP